MKVYKRFGKRFLDVFVASLLILILSWIGLLIVMLYLLTYEKTILFVQERIGKNNTFFKLFKFRSLKTSEGSLEERRFVLGDFLRFTSLDELPQLINVLKGDMSLVGPRPLPVEYLPLFSEEQQKRHSVKPGITGWAQVKGRNSIPWKKKFELDLYYVKHCSFFLDIKIIFKTILLLLSFKKDVSLEESRFTGNNE